MKLMVDISEEDYRECKFRKDLLSLKEPTDLTFNMRMEKLIANGTELPKGHGRLIDADDYIDKHEEFGWLDDIAVNEFNAITPTIVEADKENKK